MLSVPFRVECERILTRTRDRQVFVNGGQLTGKVNRMCSAKQDGIKLDGIRARLPISIEDCLA